MTRNITLAICARNIWLLVATYNSYLSVYYIRGSKNEILIDLHNLYNFANLISKLVNKIKLIPYPMDNCFTGRRDRSRQTSEKDVLYVIQAGPAMRVHSAGGASYFLFLSRHCDVIGSFSCLVLVRPLVS